MLKTAPTLKKQIKKVVRTYLQTKTIRNEASKIFSPMPKRKLHEMIDKHHFWKSPTEPSMCAI